MPLMTAAQIESVMGPGWVQEAMSSRLVYTETFVSLLGEPGPHLVHYWGTSAIYVPPHEFMWRSFPEGPSPSDCTWIVPGTGQ